MSVSSDEVSKIAHLARLGVDENKLEEYATEINSVLDLIGQMNAIDTTGVEPLAHPLHATQRLRADSVSEVNQREVLQAVAPEVRNGLFLVPKVIE